VGPKFRSPASINGTLTAALFKIFITIPKHNLLHKTQHPTDIHLMKFYFIISAIIASTLIPVSKSHAGTDNQIRLLQLEVDDLKLNRDIQNQELKRLKGEVQRLKELFMEIEIKRREEQT